jgi:hypothetical protein
LLNTGHDDERDQRQRRPRGHSAALALVPDGSFCRAGGKVVPARTEAVMTSINGATALAAVDSRVLSGLKNASENTGVDFSYLVAQASMESSLRPTARSATSSATGLFQFIEQTWLSTFREHAAKYGQGDLAAQIQVDSQGRCVVRDAATRQRILDLRKDPGLASALGAELARDNGDAIQSALGREAGPTELYLAHFLGAGGATEFLSALGSNPRQSAASLFPEAAAANRSIFYDGNGRARSLGDVYDRFAARMGREISRFSDLPMPAGLENARSWADVGACSTITARADGASTGGGMLDAMRSLARTGNAILSPTLVAALAALPVPGGRNDAAPEAARAQIGSNLDREPART